MVISFTNQKGGVAKTTSVLNVASALSSNGVSVLCIDLDAQSSLSDSVGIDTLNIGDKTIYSVLREEIDINETIQTKLGFDVIPSSIDMANADLELGGVLSRESLLKTAIGEIKKEYDVILLDCPPTLGLITINALACADKIYIPTLPELLCIKGVNLLLSTIGKIQKSINKDLVVGGVFVTNYEKNRNASAKCVEILEQQFGDDLFKTKIRRNITISESSFFNKCVISHDKNSNGAKDYMALTKEIIEREEF